MLIKQKDKHVYVCKSTYTYVRTRIYDITCTIKRERLHQITNWNFLLG